MRECTRLFIHLFDLISQIFWGSTKVGGRGLEYVQKQAMMQREKKPPQINQNACNTPIYMCVIKVIPATKSNLMQKHHDSFCESLPCLCEQFLLVLILNIHFFFPKKHWDLGFSPLFQKVHVNATGIPCVTKLLCARTHT